jgi:hypothetical protein
MKLAIIGWEDCYNKIHTDVSEYLRNHFSQKSDLFSLCLCENPGFDYWKYRGILLHPHDEEHQQACFTALPGVIMQHPKNSFIIWSTSQRREDSIRESVGKPFNLDYLVGYEGYGKGLSHEELIAKFAAEVIETFSRLRKAKH